MSDDNTHTDPLAETEAGATVPDPDAAADNPATDETGSATLAKTLRSPERNRQWLKNVLE